MPITFNRECPVIPKAANQTNSLRPRPARNYLHNVMEGHPLPSVPAVVNKLLELVQDPEVSMQNLCRVLADDPMLSARVLAVSRSPRYALRTLPTTLLGAVQVLGFRALTSLVITSATQSLRLKGNVISEKLWRHSLGVALAMRILSQRARSARRRDRFSHRSHARRRTDAILARRSRRLRELIAAVFRRRGARSSKPSAKCTASITRSWATQYSTAGISTARSSTRR